MNGIEPKELQIGNWILARWDEEGYDESEMWVDAITTEGLVLSNKVYEGMPAKWNNVFPLSLFVWGLEDFGFQKISPYTYTLEEWTCNTNAGTVNRNGEQWEDIRYVHQFQNLVATQSGKMLKTKEQPDGLV
jgi:hypothetical protein